MSRFFFFLLLFPLFACAQPAEKPKETAFQVAGDVATSPDFAAADVSARLDVYVMGDSVTCGEMAYNTNAAMMSRTRNRLFKGWAMNLHSAEAKELKGVFERLAEHYPVRMTNAAWSGAYVDKATPLDRSMANMLGNIQNFSAQMKRLRKLKTAPNLILLAPFHNNLDFQYDLDTVATLKEKKKADYLASIPVSIQREYRDELTQVISETKKGTKLSIVIFGTIDLKAALETRAEAGKLHKADPKVFPYFDVANERFPSILQPAEIVALGEKVNASIQDLASELTEKLKKEGRADDIEVVYSNALTRVPFENPKYLHPDDAFHPSALAHNRIAEAVEADLADRLNFLGVKRK